LLLQKNNIERLSNHFTDSFREPDATRIFFKGLVLYTLTKVILNWPLSRMVITHHNISFPRSIAGRILLAPTYLAAYDVDIFCVLAICFLLIIFVVKPFYFTNSIFFWLTINLYVINLPISNGSDSVLFMLALWCIPMARMPLVKKPHVEILQKTAYNLGLLFCQLQVAFIYAVSGLDKVLSETWRSGEAFAYIRNLEMLYNPLLPSFFENDWWNPVFSWVTIAYEILFVVLVWTKQGRLPILLMGVIFHLFIWIVLSLPDFAFVMMLSLMVFLKDADYQTFKRWVKQLLP
jgi:Vitamin K-dependent gamma-carboxylase